MSAELRDAVAKLIKAKGRFHTEQNYAELVRVFDATAAAPAQGELTEAQILELADDFKSQYKHGGQTFDEFDALAFGKAILATRAQHDTASDTAPKLAHGHRGDYYLMANARRVAQHPIRMIRTMQNWAFASELFATGSNSAHQICVDAGIDPAGYKVERAAIQAQAGDATTGGAA